MRNNSFLKEESLFSKADPMLKVTALLYLKEALFREEYESCHDLVARAREYGAEESEINDLLAAATKNRAGTPQGASRKIRLVTQGG